MNPPKPPGAGRTSKPNPSEPGTRGRVLVVDDDEDVRKLMHRQLTGLGYHCVTAAGAEEALGRIRGDVFDVVLSDIGMPEMNGLELLREIRRIDPKLMVVMVTASRSITHAVDALKHGAVDYIVKPFDVATLSATVARVVERKKSNPRVQPHSP